MELTRGLHADTLTAISDRSGFFPIIMMHVDWPGDPFYGHSNMGDVTWDGQSWAGIGKFAEIVLPKDAGGMAAQSASLGVRGLDVDLDTHLEQDVRGRRARIYFGAVTERDGNELIGEPFEVFAGTINGLTDLTDVANSVRTRGLRLPLISGPSQRSAGGSVSHSFEDQSAAYPGDTAGRLLINSDREGLRHRWPE